MQAGGQAPPARSLGFTAGHAIELATDDGVAFAGSCLQPIAVEDSYAATALLVTLDNQRCTNL